MATTQGGSRVTQTPVRGRITHFELTVETREPKKGFWRKFYTAQELLDCLKTIEPEVEKLEKDGECPEQFFFTFVRREDGVPESWEGVDCSGEAKAGDEYVRLFCRCGESGWFLNDHALGQFQCKDCVDHN